jgi:hypothetical protein
VVPSDKADADPRHFSTLAGCEEHLPKEEPLPLLTGEYQQGISIFSIRYFENLFGRLKILPSSF